MSGEKRRTSKLDSAKALEGQLKDLIEVTGQEQPLLPEECYQRAMSLKKTAGAAGTGGLGWWRGWGRPSEIPVAGRALSQPHLGGAVEKGATGKKVGGPGDQRSRVPSSTHLEVSLPQAHAS